MGKKLHYEFQNFLLSKGNIADKLRLIASKSDIPSDLQERVIDELRNILNSDGGVPFDFKRGAPSSTKQTSELLTLISTLNGDYEKLVNKMTEFVVSRQKKNGGFAESLKLDPYIEDKWGGVTREYYPVGKSITWLTGKALEALCAINYEDKERLRRARDFLLYSQYEDGHWPDYEGQQISDPLGTGNILLGLLAIGVNSENEKFEDGRAALLQHLNDSIEDGSLFDMADLTSFGIPKTDKEREILKRGIDLISKTQKEDGGWAPLGTKKSDPELSSKLVLQYTRANALV